ncbi:MAG: glutaminyl-peptide cyclotransferase [Flavobacteriales bacterium]
MKKIHQILMIVSCFALIVSCRKESADDLIEITTDFTKLENQKLYKNDKISFKITSKYTIDSMQLEVNGEIQKEQPFIVDNYFHLGINPVQLVVFYNGKKKIYTSEAVIFSSEKVKELNYEVVHEYPHDSSLFTQGFYYKEGIVYESAGGTGKSRVVKYKLGSKQFLKEFKIDKSFFAEGMTFLNDSLFQLTWKKRKLFIYDSHLNLLKEYNYPRGLSEGWGITQNEEKFIISDGSSVLSYVNQHDFSIINKKMYVVDDQKFYSKLNELEYYKGIIYANVWGSDEVILINPETGVVTSKINLKRIVARQQVDQEGVLNGIAIKDENLLITGKNWSKIYEIKIL